MSLFKHYKTDANAENNGVWVDGFPRNDDGTEPRFLLSRLGPTNKRYQAAMERELRPHRRAMELGTLSNEVAAGVSLNVFCNSVLVGWENVENEHGEKMAFTPANALQLLTALPDLYAELNAKAQQQSMFRVATLENAAKN